MAKTAAITVSPSTLQPGQSCIATLTVTNGDTNPVTVTNVQTYVTDSTGSTSGLNQGQVAFGPASVNQVNGSSGTLATTWGIDFFGPQTQGSMGLTASQAYTVRAILTLTDIVTGAQTIVTASTGSVTVNSLF
jgi:hypothetical protein